MSPLHPEKPPRETMSTSSSLYLLFIILLVSCWIIFPSIASATPSYYSTSDAMQGTVPVEENLSETLAQILYPHYAVHKKKSCVRRGGSCDYRGSDCCYSSACRCNIFGANCRCQRQGLFQRWAMGR